MLRVYVARKALLFAAYRRGHSHDLAEHSKRPHHPHGGKGAMRNGNVAPREEKVFAVARIKAAVGNGMVRTSATMIGDGAERLGKRLCVFGIGEVEVDAPGNRRSRIRRLRVVLEVVLGEHVVAHHAVALALAAYRRYPRKCVVGIFVALLGAVLDPVPVREDREKPVVANPLRVVGHVSEKSGLLLPRSHPLVAPRLFIDRQRPFADVRKRRCRFASLAEPLDGVSHHLARRLFRGTRLLEAAPRFGAVHRLATGEPRQNRIARRVAEELGAIPRLGACVRITRDYSSHPVRRHLDRVDILAELQERLHSRRLPDANVF